ncbi:beta-phosphoglucomutase family hydrolase [Pedobacter sp. HMF7647]|uniref:Beta-phosphoglucomutase n=1 Tax=Hufsiella arboris TaxID=2695275 RepID=A0A7K1YEB4_9SPHI|nr:beta-phosphoglucomutase family hydrolase [Hufsiella arboris]MXV52954.1 beta-phosphoglucomutase family hydrolase [Hufsiella arboris]
MGRSAFAVIFDMDGTLLDNNPYHYKAWVEFYKKRGYNLTEQDYLQNISGVPIRSHLNRFLGKLVEEEQIAQLSEEKESLYRKLYEPYIKPIDGLISFLKQLKETSTKTAIATSATAENMKFAMDHLNLWPWFDEIVDTTQVENGKPAPDIFLKAAEKLETAPEKCVVIEDSFAGINGANAADMKVIAITTSNTAETLVPHSLAVSNYNNLTVEKLAGLFSD